MTKIETSEPLNNTGCYQNNQTHILWVRRVFDLVCHADPQACIYLISLPKLELSFIKICILLMKAVIDYTPGTLAQYIFDIT